MKISEVKARLIAKDGYRVHFEQRDNGMLCSDFFPDRDEPAIAELEDAWNLAAEWAQVDPQTFVNIYVIQARDWTPVDGYRSRMLNRHPPVEALETP